MEYLRPPSPLDGPFPAAGFGCITLPTGLLGLVGVGMYVVLFDRLWGSALAGDPADAATLALAALPVAAGAALGWRRGGEGADLAAGMAWLLVAVWIVGGVSGFVLDGLGLGVGLLEGFALSLVWYGWLVVPSLCAPVPVAWLALVARRGVARVWRAVSRLRRNPSAT